MPGPSQHDVPSPALTLGGNAGGRVADGTEEGSEDLSEVLGGKA